jgi:acyl-CoA synthetase (AMP-forming)/AMP-acid ligase II
MVIRFGFNVYPAEVEGVLNAHPAVARTAVMASAHKGSEELTAFVELRPGASCNSAELAGHVAASLAPYKRPSEFIVVEALPLTPSGKILKSALSGLLDARKKPSGSLIVGPCPTDRFIRHSA